MQSDKVRELLRSEGRGGLQEQSALLPSRLLATRVEERIEKEGPPQEA